MLKYIMMVVSFGFGLLCTIYGIFFVAILFKSIGTGEIDLFYESLKACGIAAVFYALYIATAINEDKK